MKNKIKKIKNYKYMGFGFPVEIPMVEMILFRGEWTPKIDILELEIAVAKTIADAHFRLTGNHIKFIRSFMSLSLREFANTVFVSHVAVKKWESAENKQTAMSFSTEILIKFVLREFIRRRENKKLDETEIYLNQFLISSEENKKEKNEPIIYAKYA
jgi:hypothetical protein